MVYQIAAAHETGKKWYKKFSFFFLFWTYEWQWNVSGPTCIPDREQVRKGDENSPVYVRSMYGWMGWLSVLTFAFLEYAGSILGSKQRTG